MIPRIIHQTWKNRTIPSDWQGYVSSWRRHHPHWEYRLWTDEDNERFVCTFHPEFLPVWDRYPHPILKADAIRYLILHRHGGLYVDLDMECLGAFDRYRDRDHLVVGAEPAAHAAQLGRETLVTNAIMMAPAGNRVLAEVIRRLCTGPAGPVRTHLDVMDATGPTMLDDVIHECDEGDTERLPRQVYSPFPKNSFGFQVLHGPPQAATAFRTRLNRAGCLALHHWANSWVTQTAGPLCNPEPRDVPGFVFVPGVVFDGYDLSNYGRDVARLRYLSGLFRGTVGFDTDGYIKTAVPPEREWRVLRDAGENEGTYIKASVWRGAPVYRRLVQCDA
ncbi:MAG: hypothetical protein DWQ08_09585 [Proteobacteria bacterium]|nr:MAG: hypothetical protein DWQ08_09585 [Pseudomonadota bacterium]